MISALPQTLSAKQDARAASRPHVLLVLDQFPQLLGGGERVVLKLAALLPHYGFRVSILTFFVHPESSFFTMLPACPVYILPLRKTYGWTAIRAAFEFSRFLDQQQVRIVQTFFESSDIWAGAVVRLLSTAKLVWSRRDMGILRTRKHRLSYRLMAGAPDRVFAVSEQVRQYCIDVDRIEAARVETIYNGIDLSRSSSREPSVGEDVTITTVGNIRRIKGHDLFVQAAAELAQRFPNVSFSIAGEVLEPDFLVELQHLIRDLNLSKRFTLLGGARNIPELLSTADIFVMPSRSEGFSNAIIEAMAASLPVIATDVGGNAEAVQDGVNGFIIPPENAAALGQAIRRLLEDPVRARQMGAEGKRMVAEKFSKDAMMSRTVEAYAGLLGRS
ncbi:MAG: glycosyltransferase family 4 protein [Acidobacteriota bacterium]|nr:glycosyltransferase family 4 protein [Acidobacteriota bacterium]